MVPVHFQTLSKILIKIAHWLTTWQFKEGYQETEKEIFEWQWKKREKKRESLKEKGKDTNYAERI